MQVNIADAGHLRKKLTLSYSSEEVHSRRSAVLRKLGGEVKMQGFRPGKASVSVVEKRFGATATSQAEEQLLDEGMRQALKDHKLQPVGQIQHEALDRAKGLTLELSFDVKPGIVLPAPTEVGIAPKPIAIPDAQVDERLRMLQRRIGGTSALADTETIGAEDTITLDGTLSVAEGGAVVRELKGFQHLVGEIPLFGVPPEAVVAALKDQKAGASIALDAIVPQSAADQALRGKPAKLVATVASASRLRPATLEALAQRMNLSGPEAVRTSIVSQLTQQQEAQQRQELMASLMDKLLETVQVDVPAKLLEEATASAVEAASKRATTEGKQGADLEAATASAKADTVKAVKRFLIVDSIIESRQVGVTRDDINDQIRMAAMHSGRPPEEVAKRLRESGQINQVLREIREAKALEIFLDEVLGKPAPAPALAAPAHGEEGHVHGPDCQH